MKTLSKALMVQHQTSQIQLASLLQLHFLLSLRQLQVFITLAAYKGCITSMEAIMFQTCWAHLHHGMQHPSSGIQEPRGSIPSGCFASNNLPVALSQISHGSSHGHSGVTNRGGISVVGSPGFGSSMNGVGGPLPGISSSSVIAGNRNSVPGLGASPILGNVGPRITGSIGNIVGGGNIGRGVSSGGISISGLASRMNLAGNSGSTNLNLQGSNKIMSGMLQQGNLAAGEEEYQAEYAGEDY